MAARLCLVMLCIGLFEAGCRKTDETPAATASKAPASSVTLTDEAIRAAGIQVEAVSPSRLRPTLTLTGTLAAVPWTPDEQAALSEADGADAKRRLAEANFNRMSRLHREGITAGQDLDAARAELEQARATAAQADAKRANLGLTQAADSFPSSSGSWGLANVPEANLPYVAVGESVVIRTESLPGLTFKGTIVAVSRSASRDTRDFTARIAAIDPAKRLRPQTLATFEISLPAASSLTVPSSAVLLEPEGSVVFVADGKNQFSRRLVKTGASASDRISVVEGLAAGERVVVQGAQLLESERLKAIFKPAVAD
jgi:Barrel-sandwich domain of CusB or HlyD membrane-fusion